MGALQVSLLGKLRLLADGRSVVSLGSSKVEELFCFLILHPDRPHPRESLASLLWEYCTTSQSKAYLRKTLWQLQQSVGQYIATDEVPGLQVGPDWVEFDSSEHVWIDAAEVEQAFRQVRGRTGYEISPTEFRELRRAVNLYRSDLLENWYQGWCLQKRERLQYMYLSLLDKLMDYCEFHHFFEMGIEYGDRILQQDVAREHTHRRLMLLRYLAGDRTGALRQYDRCTSALSHELDVQPSKATLQLFDQIRNDIVEGLQLEPKLEGLPAGTSVEQLWAHLDRIKRLQRQLASVQDEILSEVSAVENALYNGQL